MVLLSPERPALPEVDRIPCDDNFRESLILLGIDEVHVLVPWRSDFRSAYKQVSPLIKRLPPHCVIVAVALPSTFIQDAGDKLVDMSDPVQKFS